MILDKLELLCEDRKYHCTQPIMNFFNIAGTVRASFAIHNTFEEIDIFIEGVRKTQKNVKLTNYETVKNKSTLCNIIDNKG